MSSHTEKRTHGAVSARLVWVGVIAAILGGGIALGMTLRPTTDNAPQLAAFALSPSRIRLSWIPARAGSDARYRVVRNRTVVSETAGTTFTDTGLRRGTPYAYRVNVVDSRGDVSASSPPASVTTPTKSSSPAYPLKVGPTGRYLVDQRNVPFMIVGDSPQGLITNVSVADAEKFLANRRAAGFNAMWVNLLCIVCGGANGATFDGVAPLEKPGDLSTPSEAYFARVDRILRLAEKYGIVLFLNPIETAGWLDVLRNNGVEKSYEYGRYLGNRYGHFPNVIWFHGNDFQSWRTRSDTALVQAVARGIRAAHSTQLHTVELNYLVSSSLDDESWRRFITIDSVYTYAPTYAELLKEYNRPAFMPTVMVEANYEFEGLHYATDLQTLRRQEYWSMLSGASGQFYGNKYTWPFLDGWQDHLDTPGSQQAAYAARLFADKAWFRLVPDDQHKLVTAGYGTFTDEGPINDSGYVAAARTPDGTLAIVYVPDGGTITVDMKRLSGRTLARWYDPTDGTSAAVSGSPFADNGAREFTTPGANHDGDSDWVLVLTTRK